MEVKGIQVQPEASNSLTINLDESHIADLILNFLGKKETLKFRSGHDFQVHMHDLAQFHYLLAEKLDKEQSTKIELFEAEFFYDDKSSDTVRTIESFNKHIEIRSVMPISVILSWNIVVKFRNARTVETQKVTVSLNTDQHEKFAEAFLIWKSAEIHLSIESTNRAWANEVLSIFKEQIYLISTHPPKVYSRAKKIRDFLISSRMIPIYLIAVFMLSFLIFIDSMFRDDDGEEVTLKMYTSDEITKLQYFDYTKVLMDRRLSDDHKKAFFEHAIRDKKVKDLIINKIGDPSELPFLERWKDYKLAVTSILTLLGLLFFLNFYITSNGTKSFILTTKKSEKAFENFTKQRTRKSWLSIGLLSFTIIVGLLVNFMSSHLF